VAAPSFLFQEKYGSLSATGFAKETTFGTAVTPVTQFIPTSANTFVQDPSLFFPDLMQAIRDKQVYPLYGEEKNSGAITAPLFPSNGVQLLIYAIGADGTPAQSITLTGATGSTSSLTVTGLSSTANCYVGATVTGTNIAAGTTIASIPSSSSIVLSKAPTGAISSSSLTIATGTLYQHNITQNTTAPFIPTVTVEKNLGNFQSLQFAGCMVNKYQLKAGTGNKEAEFTADMIAQTVQATTTPSSVVLINESPYVFAEFNLSLGGYNLYQATNFQLDIENDLKETYTFNGSHALQFLTPTQLKVSGMFDVVFDTLTAGSITSTTGTVTAGSSTITSVASTTGLVVGQGITATGAASAVLLVPGTTITALTANTITLSQPAAITPGAAATLNFFNPYDFFTQATSATSTTAALSFSLVHPSSNGTIIINMPNVKLSKTDQKVAVGSVITETVNFEAYYNPAGGSTPSAQSSSTISAIILNGVSTQY